MAEIRIENVPVTRVFHEGRGAEITESWESRTGEPQSRRWACWFDAPHGLVEGDVVTVVGRPGAKIDEWQDKTTNETRRAVKMSVNSAVVVGDVTASSNPQTPLTGDNSPSGYSETGSDVPASQGGDSWNTPTYDSETPF